MRPRWLSNCLREDISREVHFLHFVIPKYRIRTLGHPVRVPYQSLSLECDLDLVKAQWPGDLRREEGVNVDKKVWW